MKGGLLDSLVRASVDNPLQSVGAAAAVLAAGIWVAGELPVDVFPDLTAPTVTVLADAHGLPPQEVENLITFPLETAVNGAPGVRRVRSSSAYGFAIVWVDFDWGSDLYRSRQIVAERIQTAAMQFPEGAEPPVLGPISSIMGEIMLIGVTAPPDMLMEARTEADWTVRRALLALPGVSQVVVVGGQVREYQVRVNPDQLRARGVGLNQVLNALEGANRSTSGGVYRDGGREILIRGMGRINNIEELETVVVEVRRGSPVLMRDLAEIGIGPGVRYGTGSVGGEPAVVLSVQKQPEASTLDLTRVIDAELDQLEAQLPEGIGFERALFRQSDFISLAVDNVRDAVRDGAFLVIAILIVFLWNLRATGVTVLAMPLSLCLAVLVLRATGGSMNTMTLGGMAIAVGVLVDDAIIVVENIHRRMTAAVRSGPVSLGNRLDLIRRAARETRTPIVSATLIITIVFLPLFFLSGVEGRMLRPLGWAYVVSIFSSLLVAVTVTPALCRITNLGTRGGSAGSGGDTNGSARTGSWLARSLQVVYGRTLDWVLARPAAVLVGGLVLLTGAVSTIPLMGRAFLPEFQEGALTIATAAPPGTALQEADRIGARMERDLLTVPGVASVSRRTGRAELDEHAQGSNQSEIDARLDVTDRSLETVSGAVREKLNRYAGVAVTVGQPIGHRIDHMLSGTRAAVAVSVFGPDLRTLRELAGQIETVAQEVPGLVDVNTEQQAEVPQLHVRPRRGALARVGMTSGELAEVVDVAFAGHEVAKIQEGQRQFDVTVRYGSEHRRNAQSISAALVSSPAGVAVPLSELARIEPSVGPNAINRENGRRKVVVSANVAGRDIGGAVDELRQRVAAGIEFPREYSVQYGGQFESGQEAARRITLLSILSVVAIFLILMRSFGSARTAGLLLVNLPLALAGGIGAVFMIGGTLNVATLIGLVALFGIAVRNGILLVSRYRDLAAEGVPVARCIRQGSLERLNPILMTALTAGLALIPLALGIGEPGKEIQAPLAVVVLGGLITSTVLNMIVVPALFLRFGGLEPAAAEPAPGRLPDPDARTSV